MLVEGRAAAEALAAEVVGEQVARDDQHPRPHARPASVVALPGAHDALERGRGEILSSLRSHRIREERVDRGYVAAVDLVQVPQLVVAEPPELRHGGERTLADEPVSRPDDAHRGGVTRRASESFERLDAALSGWAFVRGRAPVAAALGGSAGGGRFGGPGAPRVPAVQLRRPLLRERDVDGVEVARDLGAREDGPGLVADLAPRVARGDVRQREQADAGLGGQLGGLARGGVAGLQRAVELVGGERGLVDQDVGAVGGHADHVAGAGVPREDQAAPAACLPYDLLRRHAVDGLAALQAAEVGTGCDAQPRGQLGVEAAGPVALDERVAVGLAAVADAQRVDLVAVELDDRVGLEVDGGQAVLQAAEHRAPQRVQQRLGAGRAEDGERQGPVAQVEGLQHSRQPEPVVEVQVGEEDLGDLGQPHAADQLPLRALAAVDQELVGTAAQQRRGQAAAGGGHGAGGAGEEDREVHRGAACRLPAWVGSGPMLKDFRQFLVRGNLVDLAVAVVVGAAFGAVVTALVKDLVTPLIAAIGGQPDFGDLAFTINKSRFAYGDFLNAVISFLIIAAVVFFLVVRPVNALLDRLQTTPPVEEE